jgi:hypothetical protein
VLGTKRCIRADRLCSDEFTVRVVALRNSHFRSQTEAGAANYWCTLDLAVCDNLSPWHALKEKTGYYYYYYYYYYYCYYCYYCYCYS